MDPRTVQFVREKERYVEQECSGKNQRDKKRKIKSSKYWIRFVLQTKQIININNVIFFFYFCSLSHSCRLAFIKRSCLIQPLFVLFFILLAINLVLTQNSFKFTPYSSWDLIFDSPFYYMPFSFLSYFSRIYSRNLFFIMCPPFFLLLSLWMWK